MASARRSSGAQVAAIIAGSLLALLALGALAVGGGLLWADGKKDDDGYFKTASHRFATSSSALATENLDISGAPHWLVNSDRYGRLRLAVRSRAGKALFVGIAPTADVARYLRGSAHATVTDIDTSPFRAEYRAHAGHRRPAPPVEQRFWAASAHGAGMQKLTWDVKHGSWSIVVMNADASAGVDAALSAGADAPILPVVAWSSLGAGAVLLTAAASLLVFGLRRPRYDRDPRGVVPAAA